MELKLLSMNLRFTSSLTAIVTTKFCSLPSLTETVLLQVALFSSRGERQIEKSLARGCRADLAAFVV